jgi:iron complex transport system ATP-binding protein
MSDPELLLLDEPAAGLDLGGREDILRRISQFAAEPTAPATVIVTHHIEEIPAGTTHVLLLKNGLVVRQGLIEDNLTSDSLSEIYGIPILLEINYGRYFAQAL